MPCWRNTNRSLSSMRYITFSGIPMSRRAKLACKAAVVDYDDNTPSMFHDCNVGLGLMFCCHTDVLETNAVGIDHILESVHKHGSVF